MNFELASEQQALQARVESFCQQHCGPEQEAAREVAADFPDPLWRAMADSGILKACLPAPFGSGGRVMEAVLITQILARHSGTAANLFLVNTVFSGTVLLLLGSAQQRGALLPKLARGELRFAFSLTEPQAGSDARAIKLSAIRDGDEFVLNGHKRYCTGGRDADYILVVCRTDPATKPSAGTSIIMVPPNTSGLQITPMDKIAGNALATVEMRFDNVRVPATNLLGGEAGLNAAWGQLPMTGALERITVAASAVGAAEAMFNASRDHALQREQFGQPIAGFQVIQHQLVDMATQIEAMKWMTYHAAWAIDAGQMPVKEISMAKAFASDTAAAMAIQAMKILGGEGYLKSNPMNRRIREMQLALYAGGTNEIQKNLVARCLGL